MIDSLHLLYDACHFYRECVVTCREQTLEKILKKTKILILTKHSLASIRKNSQFRHSFFASDYINMPVIFPRLILPLYTLL